MEHYSKEQWMDYCKDALDRDTREVMEEHLAECNSCLEIYMTALEETMTDNVSDLIPSGFVDEVMNQIATEKNKNSSTNAGRLSGRTFANYAVAAGLTIVLTFSGFFQYLSDSLPKASHSIAARSANLENAVTVGWSEHLINTTQNLINQINKLNFKE